MGAGIYSNIVQPTGSKTSADMLAKLLTSSDPGVAAAQKIASSIIGMVPPGGLRRFLSEGPWKMLWSAVFGRKYTIGQYKLGERFIKQLGGNLNAGGWQDVPNDAVEQAMNMFTILFGVRIGTGEDLDALDYGADAYYARGEKSDIPRAAVDRAVYLKQTYYPISSYDNYVWNPIYFETFPLVAPIPGLQQGTLYNGTLPGGAVAVNGVIPVNADSVIKQVLGGSYDASGNLVTPTSGGSTAQPGNPLTRLITFVKTNPRKALVFGAAAAVVINELLHDE